MTRTKKLLIATAAAATVVGGAAAVAVAQQDPGPPDLDRAAQVGRDAAGDGEVVGVEQDDDGSYDVEVRRADGTETDVDLSPTFEVVRTEQDDDNDDHDNDGDDRVLDEAARTRASDAALAHVGDGTVVSVEGEDTGYEVEIRLPDGTETDVQLDADFNVTSTETDD
jgi:uncharacterized membrane protein YkoI